MSDDGKELALDQPLCLRQGRDLTLVTWGASTTEVLSAADQLETEGISAEVIDVSTLSPLNDEPICTSVEKTGRCVVVHEAARTGGFGAEIVARIADRSLTSLLAPVRRVTGFDTVMPLPRLEAHYMPGQARIVETAREVMELS